MKIDNSIKVGFCVAYDWNFLRDALPLVYEHADLICLSIDEDRRSWANQPFDWDDVAFTSWVRKIDTAGKVKLYKDNFHLPHLTALENEVRQRNLLAAEMGAGGWHIQLDCDEYFLNFEKFVHYLKHLPDHSYSFNVVCPFVTLFKRLNNGFLYVYPTKSHGIEHFQIATRHPSYVHGRRNGHFNVYSNFLIVHQSWARSESEVKQKLLNWGHVNDFDVHAYFNFWKSVDASNYRNLTNFHPMQPECWPSMKFIEAQSIVDLSSQLTRGFPVLTTFDLFLRNSRFVAKMLRLFQIICKIRITKAASRIK